MKEKNNEALTSSVSIRDREVQQSLERLRNEYSKLHEQKIATDRDRKNLEEQLRILKEKAQRDYGTSDVEQLRKMLEERRQENERLVEEYQKHIEGIKEQLEGVEKGNTGQQ